MLQVRENEISLCKWSGGRPTAQLPTFGVYRTAPVEFWLCPGVVSWGLAGFWARLRLKFVKMFQAIRACIQIFLHRRTLVLPVTVEEMWLIKSSIKNHYILANYLVVFTLLHHQYPSVMHILTHLLNLAFRA